MSEHLRPIETGRSSVRGTEVLSTKTGVFMDTKGQMATLSMEMGVFMDKVAELMVLSMKRDVFMDERIAQKRDTLERMSL